MSDPLADLSEADRDKVRDQAFPDWVDPQLAVLTDEYFSDENWIYERKLDGVRLLAFRKNGKVKLYSRNKNRNDDTYPEIAEALEGGPDLVIDGEVVTFDGDVTSFSKLQDRMGIQDAKRAKASGVPVYFYAFDIVHFDGHDVSRLPLRGRKSVLRGALEYKDPIRFTGHRNEDGEAFLEEACRKGWEGVIAKKASAPYRFKRSKDWLKFKCDKGQELVIGGYSKPEGSRIGFGALLVGYYEDDQLKYAGRVGTGFDDQFLEEFSAKLKSAERKTPPFADPPDDRDVHWVSPKFVGEVGFTEWTGSGKLRHPRFLGLRDDKDPKSVVRERPK